MNLLQRNEHLAELRDDDQHVLLQLQINVDWYEGSGEEDDMI